MPDMTGLLQKARADARCDVRRAVGVSCR